ncbi:histidine phosphatase family protein [Pseudothauera nasutitermitis]|uniref:Histidine phosphatase family protein n=1 Tax=Pseudothauera nasutitermitis TaxID=2565930 RepID=A0A4S4ARL7_9RHOO|nr:histidine phosphatase family protein [Pseudothauera nasutitermitis]
MSTRLCLVRHGETAWNTERRLQGHLDVPLNPTGERQAEATARALAGLAPFDAIHSSDLARALRTAQAAGNALSLPVQIDADLRERHYGAFQGLTHEEAQARHPEDYRRWHGRDPQFDLLGGESLNTFATRIRHTLERIAAAHPGGRVLVFTHGGVLDVAHRLASGRPLHIPRDFSIPNAGLNWLERDAAGWRLLSWAEQDHLDDTLDESADGGRAPSAN